MANPEHLEILKQGVEVWNEWRRQKEWSKSWGKEKIKNLQFRPDLSYGNLKGEDLKGANLERADLKGANLFNANLNDATLREAELQKANLEQTNLRNVDLAKADIREANLTLADLRSANLVEANLSGATLKWAKIIMADLRNSVLKGTNLIGALLREANLLNANLSAADLSEADLSGSELSRVSLCEANLQRAELFWTDLIEADLSAADFSEASIGRVVFGNNDLSAVIGLDTVRHRGPSIIGIDTIYRSGNKIPQAFLIGCGVPDEFITYLPSLLGAQQAIQFYSCFISYSSKDQDFANRLYADLQNKGVRCWFAPEDMKIGDKFRTLIDESIRVYDKLLLVLSENSVSSRWVEKEVETAMEREGEQNKTMLFPVRLDDRVNEMKVGWPADVRRTRHIGDFTLWKDHDSYQKAFDRLLRDLKAEEKSDSKQ